MNNFQKNVLRQVPPWELCKLIPDGEFSESLFIWVNDIDNKPKIVLRPWDYDTSIAKAAPLLQEILEAIPHEKYNEDLTVNFTTHKPYRGWNVFYSDDPDKGFTDRNISTAALKLWLQLNNIPTP